MRLNPEPVARATSAMSHASDPAGTSTRRVARGPTLPLSPGQGRQPRSETSSVYSAEAPNQNPYTDSGDFLAYYDSAPETDARSVYSRDERERGYGQPPQYGYQEPYQQQQHAPPQGYPQQQGQSQL